MWLSYAPLCSHFQNRFKKETSFADILTDTLLRSILFAGDQPAWRKCKSKSKISIARFHSHRSLNSCRWFAFKTFLCWKICWNRVTVLHVRLLITPGVKRISDFCEISELLLFFSYFASQSEGIKLGDDFLMCVEQIKTFWLDVRYHNKLQHGNCNHWKILDLVLDLKYISFCNPNPAITRHTWLNTKP